MNKKINDNGFSLVELIIVIAIMAILVGALAPQFIKYVESSKQSTDMQSVNEMKTAIEAYYAENSETVSANITIGVSGSSASANVAAALTQVGIGDASGNVKLKSSGWPSETYTYDVTSFNWSAGGTATNAKKPNKKMSDVFK